MSLKRGLMVAALSALTMFLLYRVKSIRDDAKEQLAKVG